ncbi:metal-sensing transcriptional repressor [Acuticoccus sp. MNP-M23]|uniref:metal-sensing transcriptional repressor n=1 Tax=Acuticoccus sp. MNP-M23 TaxID=3072793 RepID=UPI002815A0D0|nr:metal-sensing transcriptional repressor [Acuticoccus sp. MNP-M23]WMS43807.1 metal-sensing transcriptional repressor [Acuticoccus sp. MNP-M23]
MKKQPANTPLTAGEQPAGHQHTSHPLVIKRLKRAHGHLAAVVGMIEAERPCVDIAQQLHAVEKALSRARRVLIEDHIDNCLDAAVRSSGEGQGADLAEFKAITRYL